MTNKPTPASQPSPAPMLKCCGRAMSLGIDCATHGFDPVYEGEQPATQAEGK